MTITIHRGTNEIGGSCVEITADKTRVIIDIGLSLDFEKKTNEQQELIRKQAQSWCSDVDAIFISHYHQDHHGLLSEVPSQIPLYVTPGTSSMFTINSIFLPNKKKIENVQIIHPGSLNSPVIPITIGDIKITAFTVDHSAYDACAFLIEAEGKSILYSGDIRLHGRKGILYKNLPRHVDYLILEGTNSEKDQLSRTEEEIERDFIDLFEKDSNKLNFVWCSGQHIDRLTNIFKASRKTKKTMVIDIYVAAALHEIHKLNRKIPSPVSHGIKVLYTHPIEYKADETNYSLILSKQRIKPVEIRENPGQFVVIMRPSMLKFIRTNLKVPHANVITSIYNEYEKNENSFFNWVNIQCYDKEHFHTSGHADKKSLKVIADYISPKEIIPIHTFNKEKFCLIFQQKVKLLEDNETYNI
jgi:ribonuclease J